MGKVFTQAEQDLALSGFLPFPLDYVQGLMVLLTADREFPGPAAGELLLTKKVLDELPDTIDDAARAVLIRSCNTVRHILLSETGKYTADWDFIDHSGNLDSAKRRVFPGMKVFLEDIRSPFNVGSMFRTAESFGVEELLLSPLCADPTHPRAERTAMGCVAIVPWKRISLEEMEGPVFVLETGGTPLNDFEFPHAGTMIVGSEELGASPAALERAEQSAGRVSIRTWGAKGSLNAGVAFGIALQAWADRLGAG